MSSRKINILLSGFIFIMVIVLGQYPCSAQDRTGATEMGSKFNKKKQAPKKRRIVYIVKKNTRGILYGNRCFLDVQRSMGFEYLVQPKGQPLNRNGLGRNLHNFGIKFTLYFRNGPFWQIKLNKKKKECRKLSGDFVG